MSKQGQSFRLHKSTDEMLDQLSGSLGRSRDEVLRLAVRTLYYAYKQRRQNTVQKGEYYSITELQRARRITPEEHLVFKTAALKALARLEREEAKTRTSERRPARK